VGLPELYQVPDRCNDPGRRSGEFGKSPCTLRPNADNTYVKSLLLALLLLRISSVMLNDHNMYEHILEDSIFFGVVGMLECVLHASFLR
jgi:hypothetical protein